MSWRTLRGGSFHFQPGGSGWFLPTYKLGEVEEYEPRGQHPRFPGRGGGDGRRYAILVPPASGLPLMPTVPPIAPELPAVRGAPEVACSLWPPPAVARR